MRLKQSLNIARHSKETIKELRNNEKLWKQQRNKFLRT